MSLSLVQRSDAEGRSTLKLFGTLDADTSPQLEPRLQELACSEDTTIDLAAATFIDLGAVRMLVGCREAAERSGHNLEIIGAPAYVERMLEMLDRGHYWRPEQRARRHEGEGYELPPRTTTDAERSGPESEQIVRLQCSSCEHWTFRPEASASAPCEKCGSEMEAVAVFRDRRQKDRPVQHERRRRT